MADLLSQLSSEQGRFDQNPNKAIGKEIARTTDAEAVLKIQSLLPTASEKILFDLLKVLETIGEINPDLIQDLFDDLLPFLDYPKNKIVWMAMSALSHISVFHPETVYLNLGKILQIMDEGGVITRDKGFVMLIQLYPSEEHQEEMALLIREQLLSCPPNQFGQYVEKWMAVINENDIPTLEEILESRIPELTSPYHQKRAVKNFTKLRKRKT